MLNQEEKKIIAELLSFDSERELKELKNIEKQSRINSREFYYHLNKLGRLI